MFVLEADAEDIIERLLRRAREQGRADDTPEVIARRIRVYERETADLTMEYAERGLLHRMPGHPTVSRGVFRTH